MGQGTVLTKIVSIIGGGPSGALAAILIAKSTSYKVQIFDYKKPLSTLLPTGGGRCNLTYYEPDFKELVKFYPRGEKFLLSVFSKFNSLDMMALLDEMGIETYIQEDLRVFPSSNSAKNFADKLLNEIEKYNVKVINEKVANLKKDDKGFTVSTEKSEFNSNFVVFSTGGKGNGFDIAKELGHKIEPIKPSLCPLKITEEPFYSLSGLALPVQISAQFEGEKVCSTSGDLLFTHNSISGPAVFKLSALCAYYDFNKDNPLKINMNICGLNVDELSDFIEENKSTNPNKAIKNVFPKIINKRLLDLVLNKVGLDEDKQIVHLSKKEKQKIIESLTALELYVIDRTKGGEIVTAGGVCLDEINPKSMESKVVDGLYFAGEVINVDGFTGGFNLQNCWSTAYICANDIINH